MTFWLTSFHANTLRQPHHLIQMNKPRIDSYLTGHQHIWLYKVPQYGF